MPIYEYVCKACGEQFEKLTALANAHLPCECPKCGEKTGERVLSVTSSLGASASGGGSSCGHSGFG
ncbi:MAG: zinc ribbon domain-containing protein [Nitrospinae bacterium]|nr:zinc ribbon domain-containing protein [Nitrospinota bacterium]